MKNKQIYGILFICSLVFQGILGQSYPVAVVQTAEFTGDRLTPQANIYFTSQTNNAQYHLNLDSTQTFQEIFGFGGAFTEASAYVFSQLTPANQQAVLEAYWSPTSGLNYSVGRVPMNSCDFSLASYNFDNVSGDYDLSNFDISHDKTWLMPFIKAAMQTSNIPIRLYLTPWSPPAWMKGNGEMDGSSQPGLIQNANIFQSWSLYYSKFLTAYKSEGIPFWGLTIQNEPEFPAPWEACVYTPEQERDFLKNYLGPKLFADHPEVKIMIYDHNKDHIFNWANTIFSDPDAAKYASGTAFHWYSGSQFDNVLKTHNAFPDKFLLATEACNCPPSLGDWEHGESYAYDIIGDLNAFTMGWVDWNLMLDIQGGPNHLNNWCDSPILADLANQTLYFQPHYYYMGQISKFFVPGSVRIGATLDTTTLSATAARTPDGRIVFVILNMNNSTAEVNISYKSLNAVYTVPEHGIATFYFNDF